MSYNKIYSGMENAPDAIDKNFNTIDDWAGEIGDPALLAKLSEEGATNIDTGNFDPESMIRKKNVVVVNEKSKAEVYRRNTKELTTKALVLIGSRIITGHYLDLIALSARAGELIFFESVFSGKTHTEGLAFSAAVENVSNNRDYDIVIYAESSSTSPGNVSVMEIGLEGEV